VLPALRTSRNLRAEANPRFYKRRVVRTRRSARRGGTSLEEPLGVASFHLPAQEHSPPPPATAPRNPGDQPETRRTPGALHQQRTSVRQWPRYRGSHEAQAIRSRPHRVRMQWPRDPSLFERQGSDPRGTPEATSTRCGTVTSPSSHGQIGTRDREDEPIVLQTHLASLTFAA
jgi:hypothetical protein